MRKLIAIPTKGSRFWGNDDGTVTILEHAEKANGIESPVHLYEVEKIATFEGYLPKNTIILQENYENVVFMDTSCGYDKYVFDKNELKGGDYKVYKIYASTDPDYVDTHHDVSPLYDITDSEYFQKLLNDYNSQHKISPDYSEMRRLANVYTEIDIYLQEEFEKRKNSLYLLFTDTKNDGRVKTYLNDTTFSDADLEFVNKLRAKYKKN